MRQLLGKEHYSQMIKEDEPKIEEFISLGTGALIAAAPRLYAEKLVANQVVTKVVTKLGEQQNDITRLEGENKMLQLENSTLREDLQDINKYDEKKYAEMRRRHQQIVLAGNKNDYKTGIKILRQLFP